MYGIQRCREGEKKVQIRIKVIKKRPGPLSGCVGLLWRDYSCSVQGGC
jgi:hypothetical protein